MPIAQGVYKVVADTKQAVAANKGLGASLKGAINPATLGAAAIGAVGIAAFKTVANTVSLAGELQKMSIRTGLSTESLSQMQFALEQSGTDIGVFEKGLKTMSSTIFDASKGLATQNDALDALGVELTDLQGLSPEEQFAVFADALSDVEDASTRAALAQDIFGGAGTKLLPILTEGKDGIEALKNEADELGRTIGTDTANNAAVLQDNINTLKSGFTGLQQNLAQAVIPILADLTTKFKEDALPVIRDEFIPAIKDIAEVVLPILQDAFKVIGPVIQGVFDNLLNVVRVFSALLKGDWEALGQAVLTLFTGPLKTAERILSNFGVSVGDIWIGIARVAQDALNAIIGSVEGALQGIIGGANAVLGFFKLPKIEFQGLGRVSFADNLETSAERTRRYRADTRTVTQSQFLADTGVGQYSTGDPFGRGGRTTAPIIQLNGTIIAPGGQEAAQWVADNIERSERTGYLRL